MQRIPAPIRHSLGKLWACETFRAALILVVILHVLYFPCLWGNRSLLESAQDAPSILFQGAWTHEHVTERLHKVVDPGAPAWLTEPWLAVLHNQYFHQKTLPLWNPYQGYGQPFAADLQSQPFYPLTLALLVHLTPRTYSWYILSRLFVAGICAYLYLRLFLSFYSALSGGITSMLAGYYVLLMTLPHLSVEILLPASLLASEYLLRAQTYKTLLSFALLMLLAVLGGMPESALLLFTFADSYLLLRIFSDPSLRATWRRHVGRLLLASVIGVALSAFFLLPFLDFFARSSNSHRPTAGFVFGHLYDPSGLSIVAYLSPLLFGDAVAGVWEQFHTNIRSYTGWLPFVLIVIAAIRMFRRRTERDRMLNTVSVFFFVWIVLCVLKRYGLFINWVGDIPLFRMVDFPKYGAAEVSIAVSMLSAIGLERIIRRDVSRRELILAFAICASVLALIWIYARSIVGRELASGGVTTEVVLTAILVPACVFLCFIIWVAFYRQHSTATGIFICTLLALELSFNYILPTSRFFTKLPLVTENPYRGAPFVDFLHRKSGHNYRIFGRDAVLTPDWAGPFGLYDIRNIDGVYDRKYFPFLLAFLQPARPKDPELESCFLGFDPYPFDTPLERRLLQLSSVKYLATVRPYIKPGGRIDELFAQDQRRVPAVHLTKTVFEINGDSRDTLMEHPPYSRLPYRIRVPAQSPVFYFSYGIAADAFDKGGDGVLFVIEAKDPRGNIHKLFSNYIDPKHDARQRKWMDGALDLSTFRGETIDLLFSTDPGPHGNSAFDWAGWSNFHFASDAFAEMPSFKRIYHGPVSVYEYDNVLPRAALFSHVEMAGGAQDVLRKLADPATDIFGTVVVNASELDRQTKAALEQLNRDQEPGSSAAAISSYQSQSVTIQASVSRPAVLMLNDTADPDWTVQVDGEQSRWFPADYLFRGVLLKPGTHTVQFSYRPRSFYLGVLISAIAALFVTCLFFAIPSTRHRRAQQQQLAARDADPAMSPN